MKNLLASLLALFGISVTQWNTAAAIHKPAFVIP
jgi:hypothetical protein